MNTYKVKAALPIVNLDTLCVEGMSLGRFKHSELLPNHVRFIMCGPSGLGKTTVMLNLLFDWNRLKVSKCLFIQQVTASDGIQVVGTCIVVNTGHGLFSFTDNDDVIRPDSVQENSVMMFDDVACEKQNKIRNYFAIYARDVDTFYLCHTYNRIPKQLVRDTAKFLVWSRHNLKHVFDDHVITDMTYSKFY